MATCVWTPRARATYEVKTITPSSVDIGDTFTLTINRKSITVTATAATVANVIGLLVTAWGAETSPEFTEITATNNTTNLLLTANTAGVPFTVTGSSSGGSLSVSTTTTASGPNFWNDTNNWSGAALPTAGDAVVFENSNIDCLYGFPSSIALASLKILASYTGKIGLPDQNSRGYYEYRTKALAMQATTIEIGAGEGNGSAFIRLDTTGTAAGITVFKTNRPTDAAFGAVHLIANTASTTLEVLSGSVCVATLAGETAQLSAAKIGYVTNPLGDSTVRFGTGVTFSAGLDISGGKVETASNIGTVTQTDGEWTHLAGTVTNAVVYGGKAIYSSTGTLTDATVGSKGNLDFSADMSAKTVTNAVNLALNAKLNDPFGVVGTLKFKTVNCTLDDVDANIGRNKTYTPS